MVSKEEKKYLDNLKYMGGSSPIHVSIYVEQKKCRISFITAAHPLDETVTLSAGCDIFAVVDKENLPGIIEGLQRAYDYLS